MRIAYVNYEDTVGRRFNGYDLCNHYIENGDQCVMFTRFQSTDESFQRKIWPGRTEFVRRLATRFEKECSIRNMLYPPMLSWRKEMRSAEVIHLHSIAMEYMSTWEAVLLHKIAPIVMSLHDFTGFTACCAHPHEGTCENYKSGCHSCPDHKTGLFPLKRDTTNFLWNYKRKVWAKVRPDIVVASKWMLQAVGESPLFAGMRIHCIPFGLDLNIFTPADKQATRKALGIPLEHFVIMFRALESPYKGLETIKNALRLLRERTARPITLLVLNGVGLLDEFLGQYRLHEVELVRDQAAMAQLYQASDLFLMPSTRETFGMMAMEGMACGVPSIVSEGTALMDVVRAPEAGLAIAPGNAEQLAQAMQTFLDDATMRAGIGKRARELAVELYDFRRYAADMRALYTSLLPRQGSMA
jgi:glycosyltransferase involved in cell wall biosynthesis